MTGGIVEIDLHGKNAYQARVTIDAALRRARAGTYRLRIIHGYQGGTVLRDMVRQEYAGRVLRVVPLDQGRTDLVPDRIFITHSGVSPEIVEMVRGEIRRHADFREITETRAGCTISSHCGPDCLGILFVVK